MSSIKLTGDTSGEITISAPAVAGTNTLTLPASTGEITTGGNNTPAFVVRLSSNQAISDNVTTKIAFDVEDVDTDSAFASNKFTVPSGKAGLYKFDAVVRVDALTNSNLTTSLLYLYKNGTAQHIAYNNYSTNQSRAITMNINSILNLSVGDYIELYAACNTVNGNDAVINSNKYAIFSGHKLIG
jgi:hypothetical protein